jgi:hypothetical protein
MQSALIDVLVDAVNDVVTGGFTVHFESGVHLAAVVTIAALVVAGVSADLVPWRRPHDQNPKEQS